MEKIPYSRHIKAVSDGTALFFVLDNPTGHSTWLFVQNIAVEDETLNFNNIRVGRGTDEFNAFWWRDRPVPAAGVVYHFDEMFFVPPGERLIVRFDGTLAGHRLNVWIDGYTTEKVITGRPDKPGAREA